jgi:very-short-patch-repair endonuclease
MRRVCAKSVNFSRALRTRMSDGDARLWRELRSSQLGVQFRQQHPIGRYIADFASLQARLCIEADGAQHADNKQHDEARTAFPRAEGYWLFASPAAKY